MQIKDLRNVKKTLYRTRRKFQPSLPSDLLSTHVSLDKLIVKTKFDENFLLLNDPQSNMVFFGTGNNLKFLSASKIIYIDGSFDYATNFFKQIFTFHGFFNGHYIPLAFCLLKDKREITYRECFKKLCILCAEKGLIFNPPAVVVDFELTRTTNACESFHSHFNKSHASIYF